MKKVSALILAISMMFVLVACGEKPVSEDPVEVNPVQEFFDLYGDEFLTSINDSFASAAGGLTCESNLEINGNHLTVNICIQGVDNIPDDVKKQMQDIYNGMSETFEATLTEMQTELPELEAVTYNVCEQDGDILAVIETGK